MKDFNNLDGEVINYDVVSAMLPVPNPRYENKDGRIVNYDVVTAMDKVPTNSFDQDNFYPADGLDGLEYDVEFSNTIGNRKARQKRRAERRAERRKRGFLGLKDRAKRKQTEADAQLAAAQNIGKDSKADIALAQSLGTLGGSKKGGSKKGLSTIAWAGIGVGILALLGVTIYLVKRKK